MSQSSSAPLRPVPPWMARTFGETEDGFFFAPGVAPPLGDHAWSRGGYWTLANALWHLHQGDFNIGDQVATVLLQNDDQGIWFDGGQLLAHGVPHTQLRAIGERLLNEEKGDSRSHDFVRSCVCAFWARAMMLSAVPDMIELYRRTTGVSSRIQILIELADMFEPARGNLYDEIDVESDTFDENKYLALLLEHHARAEEQVAAAGTGLFYRGAPFVFPDYAQGLLKRIAANNAMEHFMVDRMIFEANSGIRCSSFFSSNADLVPLAAAAIVEEFLDSDNIEKYQLGARYFMGHRIPD